MVISLDIISWYVGIILLLIIIFFIYLFFGGGNYEYIGLSPLEIGYDASRQVKHSQDTRKRGEEGQEDEGQGHEEGEQELEINNTPIIPNLSNIPVPEKKEVEVKNYFCSLGSHDSLSYENPSVGNLVGSFSPFASNRSVESSESYENINLNIELPQTPQTPRTLQTKALGPYKCYNGGKMSKFESLCKQAIEEITGKSFYCVRPDFLKNPETGRKLELDLYNDELRIALEASGKQHFVYPNIFHKTREEFIKQVRRDIFKVDTCDANGIYLITVPYNVPANLEDIKKYILYYMPENAHLRN